MQKIFITFLLTVLIKGSLIAQQFSPFSTQIPALQLYHEVVLAKEADATRYPISAADGEAFLSENDGEHYALGKITLSRSVVLFTYFKPKGVAPLGKITATTFTLSGKKVAAEVIGVFADFAGMHFRTTISTGQQQKGAVSVTGKVESLRDDGEVNPDMSKTTIYYISAKGKITKL